MIIKEVTQIGDPLLRRPARLVIDVFAEEVQQVIKDLIDSVRHHELIGMAAPQISHDLRVFVTEVRKTQYRDMEGEGLRVYINPKITWKSEEEVEIIEGCGSVAYSKLFAPIMRSAEIEVEALDQDGKEFSLKADGMLARVIQHELDHLDGREFTNLVMDNTSMMSSGEYQKRMG